MDRALWISWYDLQEQDDKAYLPWLHETYIPGILRRPGILWAAHYASMKKGKSHKARTDGVAGRTADSAVPAGDRYILVFGAEHTHAFADPYPSALHAGLPDGDRKMLAMRIGERVSIMAEAARVEGPAAKDYKDGLVLAPCINLGSFNYPYPHEEEMMGWYAQRRMFAMSLMPGCVRTRKLASVAGWARHAIVYEFASLEAHNQYFSTREDLRPEQQEWSERVVARVMHAPGSSHLACRIWAAASN